MITAAACIRVVRAVGWIVAEFQQLPWSMPNGTRLQSQLDHVANIEVKSIGVRIECRAPSLRPHHCDVITATSLLRHHHCDVITAASGLWRDGGGLAVLMATAADIPLDSH